MPLLTGLPCEHGDKLRILILGSFPSPLSLEAREYYANPRNQFWNIIEVHLGIVRGLPYREKLVYLGKRNIGLWDVISSCERRGAMDSSIRNVVLNDIPLFIHDHPTVRIVIVNGTAAGMYLGKFDIDWRSRVSVHILPSIKSCQCQNILFRKTRGVENCTPGVN